MQYAIIETEWGAFGYVVRDGRLVATFLPSSRTTIKRAIKQQWPDAVETPSLLPRFRKQVNDYFAGNPSKFTVDLDISDLTPFRQSVLKQCRRIPCGKTASYADLARAVGNPRAVRAVGGAMANNPLPLVIPCHRVLRSDGTIGGFSTPQGVKQKKRMLRLEDAPAVSR